MEPYKTIKYPLQTEKTVKLVRDENKLVFVIDKKSKKEEIKKALEELFQIKIIKINTMIDSKGRKKAYVKLSPDTPAIDITTRLGMM